MGTFDLKNEAWKVGESPDMEVSCSGCVKLGLVIRTVSSRGMPTALGGEWCGWRMGVSGVGGEWGLVVWVESGG